MIDPIYKTPLDL